MLLCVVLVAHTRPAVCSGTCFRVRAYPLVCMWVLFFGVCSFVWFLSPNMKWRIMYSYWTGPRCFEWKSEGRRGTGGLPMSACCMRMCVTIQMGDDGIYFFNRCRRHGAVSCAGDTAANGTAYWNPLIYGPTSRRTHKLPPWPIGARNRIVCCAVFAVSVDKTGQFGVGLSDCYHWP